MVYVTGALCGNLGAYKELLGKINLKKRDDLYIIGDIIGRFGESFALLEDMSMRENVFPILGNNEFAALKYMKCLSNDDGTLKVSEKANVKEPEWLVRLLENFVLAGNDSRAFMIEYLSEMPLFEEFSVNNTEFVLTNKASEHFWQEVCTDSKTVITATDLFDKLNGNKIVAICLDNGREYFV